MYVKNFREHNSEAFIAFIGRVVFILLVLLKWILTHSRVTQGRTWISLARFFSSFRGPSLIFPRYSVELSNTPTRKSRSPPFRCQTLRRIFSQLVVHLSFCPSLTCRDRARALVFVRSDVNEYAAAFATSGKHWNFTASHERQTKPTTTCSLGRSSPAESQSPK